jgi:putative two-component system response regulator
LSRALGLDDEFSETVFLAAPLHDIGKIGIPDSILLKPGKLTDTEWVTMRRHTEFGAQILRSRFVDPRAVLDEGHTPGSLSQTVSDGLMLTAANIALNHHERWDGSGYPNGIAGEEIPIEARLTTIADVYDALSSVRPYKPAFPEEKVLSIMREGVGTQFDPTVFDAFERSLDVFRSIQRSLQDTDEDFAKLPTTSKPAG